MRALARLALAAVMVVSAPAAARADGLPVLGVDAGGEGLAVGERERLVTFTLPRSTVLARVAQDGGRVVTWVTLPGRFTIPAVAYDGSAAGLSRDRRSLVLVRPRIAFPQRSTRFAIVDVPRLRMREVLELPGDFSFDAVSPDGRLLYLVEYLSPNDPTRYLVRLYDVERKRLRPEPVIDPREVGDVMRGEPVTRAASADGRWAYTLYNAPDHPFVHALDTVGRTARCIDLHELRGHGSLSNLVLEVAAGRLDVREPSGEVVARIDTASFAVAAPEGEERDAAAGAATTESSPGGRDWAPFALSVPGLALIGTALLLSTGRGRRRR